MTPKNDDGLIAPDGFEIERWPDGSPRYIDIRKAVLEQHWLSNDHVPIAMNSRPSWNPTNPYDFYRIALKPKPVRKLLDFRGAVAAHEAGKTVLCDGRPDFKWLPNFRYPDFNCGSEYGIVSWMLDRTDFYVSEDGQ